MCKFGKRKGIYRRHHFKHCMHQQYSTRRSQGALKMISRTVKGQEVGQQYKFHTTRGVDKRHVFGASFVSYYQLSHIPWATFDLQERSRYWCRMSDMIHITGIQTKFQMILKVKSGFQVCVLLLQTPVIADQILDDPDDSVPDNSGSSLSNEDPMGSFNLQSEWLSAISEHEPSVLLSYIVAKYAGMFARQMEVMRDWQFHNDIMKMKVTHPNVMVLGDC